MNFQIARESIVEILLRNNGLLRYGMKDRAIVGTILWSVYRTEGVEDANSLIRYFNLNMFDRGSFDWFDGEGAGEYRPLLDHEDLIAERMNNSYEGKKISMKGIA